jgi:predicted NACHT family NTPase
LLVLDSYDESTGSDQLRQHLQQLINSGRDIQVVLTSRPNAVPENVSRLFAQNNQDQAGPRRCTAQLLPMTDDESAALRSHVAGALGIDHRPLEQWLISNNRLELTSNPLLSVLCVLAARQSEGDLPTSVPELYERAIAEIVRQEARKQRADSPSIPTTTINRRIKTWMNCLDSFAWAATTELEPSKRRQLLDSVPTDDTDEYLYSAGFEDADHRLALSVLTLDHKGYRFLHRTIHEHLVARHSSRTFDDSIKRHLEFWQPWEEIAASTLLQLTPDDQHTFATTWLEIVPLGSSQDFGLQRLDLICRTAASASPDYWTDGRSAIATAVG